MSGELTIVSEESRHLANSLIEKEQIIVDKVGRRMIRHCVICVPWFPNKMVAHVRVARRYIGIASLYIFKTHVFNEKA